MRIGWCDVWGHTAPVISYLCVVTCCAHKHQTKMMNEDFCPRFTLYCAPLYTAQRPHRLIFGCRESLKKKRCNSKIVLRFLFVSSGSHHHREQWCVLCVYTAYWSCLTFTIAERIAGMLDVDAWIVLVVQSAFLHKLACAVVTHLWY